MTEPVLPRIRCAICNKPVDCVTVYTDGPRYSAVVVDVECHGATDRMEISAIDAMNLGPEGMRQLLDQEGIAFLNARLELAWADFVNQPVSDELVQKIATKAQAVIDDLTGGGDA